ncbi:MAG: hypothetical protein DMG06_24985 [Acidobacteria bacterium]|nr:MAG: hypothetical protein DMG06_24985 [Acidobacteriota bacterium]
MLRPSLNDLGENVDGVICVGAPIFDQRGRVVAGLSVSGPTSRMESKLSGIRDDVRQAGLKISRMLGPLKATDATPGKMALPPADPTLLRVSTSGTSRG